MAKNPDGTYSQVGFIKDADGNDTEYIYDKDGTVIFEKGFTREKSGTLPLQIDGIGKPLKNYTIYGNTLQNGTPTPDNPVEVQAVGDRTGNLFDGWEISKTFLGLTCKTSENMTIVLNGTRIPGQNAQPITRPNITLKAGTYTVSCKMIGGYIEDITDGVFFGINQSTYAQRTSPAVLKVGDIGKRTFTLTEDTIISSFDITPSYGSPDAIFTDATFECQLNEGETALPFEPYGYKIPITTESEDGTESITTTVYLDKPLYKNGDYADFVEYSTQIVTRYCDADDNGVFLLENPVTKSVTLPKIPTLDGVTVIDTATEIKPSKMDIKYKSKT